MPELLLATVEYGGYISVIELVIFLVLFFAWLPLVGWVYRDAGIVGTNEDFWTGIVFGAGIIALIIWQFIPVFIIGMLLYLIAVGATSISYVMHRNAKVPDFDRVLTADHIKGLLSNEQKKLDALQDFIFITSNNNEVPIPEARTPDFFGFKAAYNIFADATWRRASDVVLAPTQQDYNVTYYIDGTGLKQPSIPKNQIDYLIRFVKHLAGLDPDEKRKPQKGKFRIYKNKENTYWEVATAGSTAGEQILLKHLTQEKIDKLEDLGLLPDQYHLLSSLNRAKQGVFLVAGPKKTGVTTTFYALLRNHDAFMSSISTLEKKPTGELPNITRNVYTLSDTGTTTYAKKLQEVVRMEPDIVGVADCEDAETAKVACAAAKDGKVVYVALDAENAIKAVGKWMKLVDNKAAAVRNLIGVSNQRLLRKLCEECKQAYEPNKELLHKFNIPADKAKVLYRAGKEIYDKRGKARICENCQGTGFVSRMCVYEIILLNDELRKAIFQAQSLAEVGTHFRRAKMLYLQEQALKKVVSGITAINEVIRVLSGAKKQNRTKPK
ncbi:MAG: Flp pilus assembly complex ATPase component TadA [Sedimentisphaerales bacterium]|nr:Flp pilus assembly complex ATPase component TadA [Sedimentisphaerales bacterium]